MKAITVQNISKKYVLKHKSIQKPTNFKEKLLDIFGVNKSEEADFKKNEEFWALKNVSFDINQGDRVGIIGANGAGKSTMLKILSRITEPTTGKIHIRGRVASLLEVGTGFHPELSGRENIYLNGAILGMSRKEITARFDEIVDFSGVEKFLDTPVKRYSSGMYVRLGFSIAAHLEPDIMIVDEVLAVGDSEFQKKCLGKMKDVSLQGRTVLFVSHNLTSIEALCNTAVYLKKGEVHDQGDVKKVLGTYLSNHSKNILNKVWNTDNPENEYIRINSVEVRPKYVDNQNYIDVRTAFEIITQFDLKINCDTINVSLFVMALTGEMVCNVASVAVKGEKGSYSSACGVPGQFLNDGGYTISILIVKDSTDVLYNLEEPINFEVADWRATDGEWYGKWPGVVRPSLPFTLSKN